LKQLDLAGLGNTGNPFIVDLAGRRAGQHQPGDLRRRRAEAAQGHLAVHAHPQAQRQLRADGTLARLVQYDLCQLAGTVSERKYEKEGGPGLAACADGRPRASRHLAWADGLGTALVRGASPSSSVLITQHTSCAKPDNASTRPSVATRFRASADSSRSATGR
jgi:hypothetical protein